MIPRGLVRGCILAASALAVWPGFEVALADGPRVAPSLSTEDEEIIRDLDFFYHMDVIESEELAANSESGVTLSEHSRQGEQK